MQIQNVNGQNFKGLQYHPNHGEIDYILATKLGGHGFDKAMKLLDKLSANKTAADVFQGGDLAKTPRIYVEVAGKVFKENLFFGPISTLKKALKYSNKLEKNI